MNEFREYQDLMQSITAPEYLKKEVLSKMKNSQNKGKFETAKRSHHMLRNVGIAAALAVAIPLGVFAAANSKSLMDYLRKGNLENPEAYAQLMISPEETSSKGEMPALASGKDENAEYRVLEAINDGESLYIHMNIKPLDQDTMFIFQDVMMDDSVGNLQIPGVTEGTVQQYADSIGKKPRYADIGVTYNGNGINGWGTWAETNPDGSMDLYGSGNNPTKGGESVDLEFAGHTYDLNGNGVQEYTKFQMAFENKSQNTETLVFKTFDPSIEKDYGVVIESMEMKKTELGYYCNFTYHLNKETEDKIQKSMEAMRESASKDGETMPEDSIKFMAQLDYLVGFIMVDEKGEFFQTHGPVGGSEGIVDNGDGTYSYCDSIPMVEHPENMKFKLLTGDLNKVGCYSFSK